MLCLNVAFSKFKDCCYLKLFSEMPKEMFETLLFICLCSWSLAGKHFYGLIHLYIIICPHTHTSVIIFIIRFQVLLIGLLKCYVMFFSSKTIERINLSHIIVLYIEIIAELRVDLQ